MQSGFFSMFHYGTNSICTHNVHTITVPYRLCLWIGLLFLDTGGVLFGTLLFRICLSMGFDMLKVLTFGIGFVSLTKQ